MEEKKKRKKKSKTYFTKETEDYIVKYNNSTDIEYRNRIFTEHIYYPFYKLVENIIHTFKFYYIDTETVEELKFKLISILLEEKIDKFDPSRGAKAYSYFGTIVKRWLINYNNNNYKKLKQTKKIESYIQNSEEHYYEQEIEHPKEGSIDLTELIDLFVEKNYKELENTFKDPEDRVIADAVLQVFKSREDIQIFKKKAIYIYIREITGTDTSSLTRIINVLKENFYKLYREYSERDLLHFA